MFRHTLLQYLDENNDENVQLGWLNGRIDAWMKCTVSLLKQFGRFEPVRFRINIRLALALRVNVFIE